MSLRECPFCGGDASMPAPRTGQLPITIIAICSRCYASVARTNEAAALAAWNRRAPGWQEGAEAMREAVVGWCDDAVNGERELAAYAERARDTSAYNLHKWLETEHTLTAAAIRAMPLPEPPK